MRVFGKPDIKVRYETDCVQLPIRKPEKRLQLVGSDGLLCLSPLGNNLSDRDLSDKSQVVTAVRAVHVVEVFGRFDPSQPVGERGRVTDPHNLPAGAFYNDIHRGVSKFHGVATGVQFLAIVFGFPPGDFHANPF
jgi:hypothetical protein